MRPRSGGFELGQGLVVASPGNGQLVRDSGFANSGGDGAGVSSGSNVMEIAETEPSEVAAIAEAAARLMQRPDLWAEESAAALRRAREQFAPEVVVADLAALIGSLGLSSDGGMGDDFAADAQLSEG
jgi:glycosyltransferase involved in cell wall biosynthesis